jgi:lipopolysaccharide/colanic/teichoic acid biosynthesis glycosyltransferase
VGRDGRLFRILKLRSMVANAEKQGPAVTAARDNRVTKVGRLLRRYKLDELPQLINVLRADMSLVGPRPEDPRYVALYSPEQRRVLTVRPGITGIAALSYRDEEQILDQANWEHQYITKVMPRKLALELNYLEHRSIGSDLGLVFRTILGLPAPAIASTGPILRAACPSVPESWSGEPYGTSALIRISRVAQQGASLRDGHE